MAGYADTDRFESASGSSVPARRAVAITPHDSTNLAYETRAVYVGVGGNITCVMDGEAVLFTAVPTGTVLPIRTTRVNSTGTTASALVALR